MTEKRVFGRFTDGRGNTFDLLEGHRDSLKPGWRAALKPWGESYLPSPEAAEAAVASARPSVEALRSVLLEFGLRLDGRDLLEAGCFTGARSHLLARAGARRVVGSDIPVYHLLQKRGVEVNEGSLRAQRQRLDTLREEVRRALGPDAPPAGAVRFEEDDLCASSFPDGSFDMVCSWDVLEHVRDPGRAFAETARLLRPGGLAFHEYNPFFGPNGGHSLCTLDFPWGHARLPEADFLRYLAEVRPGEADVAGRFYRFNLNRMTLAECGGHARAAGFETLALDAPPDGGHLAAASPGIVRQVSAVYPSATAVDLAAPWVRLVLRKP